MLSLGTEVEVKKHPGWGLGRVLSHREHEGEIKNFVFLPFEFGGFYRDDELIIVVDLNEEDVRSVA
ncbi:MAG TPA: hypothetical protein VE134_06330 [Methanomicrobiales archaeon]|jgi:hypothetical protein|nr:hypothetical protein [Methanomicrobiales archaeon]